MKVNVKVQGNGFDNAAKTARSIPKAVQTSLKVLSQDAVKETQERIRTTKKDPEGRAWAPWSMATIRARNKDGTAGRGLLWRTGALLNSIQSRVRGWTAEVWSTANHARFIQFGTPKMTARPFLGFSPALVNRLADLIKKNTK